MWGGRHKRSAVGVSARRYREERSRKRWILLSFSLVFGALFSLFTVRSLEIRALHTRLAQATIDYEQAWNDRADLESRLASKDNLLAIEDAARRLLGWVMPGEERVIFVNPEEETSSEGE